MRPQGPARRLLRGVAAALAPLLVAMRLEAADPPTATGSLPDLTIVAPPAQPGETSLQRAREEVAAVPGGAALVDGGRWREGSTASLAGFLRSVPGVFAVSQTGGQDTRLSIRGSGIQSDDVLGVMVLQDGVPINEGDGEADIEELDLGGVRYAQVWRGADALRYGGTGLGGAINLVSPTGRDTGPLDGRVEGGSAGYRLARVASGWARGAWDGLLSAGDQRSDGFRAHSAESVQRVAGDLGWSIAPEWRNRLHAGYVRLDRDLPDDLTREDLEADPRRTSQDSIDQDFHRRWWEVRVSDQLAWESGPRAFTIAASVAHRQWRQNDIFTPDDPVGILTYRSTGVTGDLTWSDCTPWGGRANALTLGMLPTWELEPDHYAENLGGQPGATIAEDRTVASSVVWYAEDRHALGERWTAVLGAQLALAHRTWQDRFADSPTFGATASQGFTGCNPKLGAIYAPDAQTRVYANLSGSFQPPSFDDLVVLGDGTGPLYAYVPLRAQRALTAEVGTRGDHDGLGWDLSLYRSWVRDELLEVNDALGNDVGTVNASPTVHQGVEAGLELDLLELAAPGDAGARGRHLVLEQSYTLNDFRFRDDAVYGRNRVAGIPGHVYKASLLYHDPSGFYGGPLLDASLARYPVDQANTLFADPYVLIGARAGWAWDGHGRVFIEAANLADRTYAATVAPIPDARTTPDPAVFRPGTGRTFVCGVEASW